MGWNFPSENVSQWGELPRAKPSERRSSPRHPASPNEAWVGWWVGDKFHSVAAQFRELSSSGALILTREIPANGCVWIGLDKPFETRWVPMKAVRFRETSGGLIEVGLAFQAFCGSDLFEALISDGELAVDTSLPVP
jgi:hypothetical protein